MKRPTPPTPLQLKAALGRQLPLVAMLLAAGATVGLDYALGVRVLERSDQLLHNAMRSIELMSNLRAEVAELAQPGVSAERVQALTRALDADARAYQPLATFEGERDEWDRLEPLLRELEAEAAAGGRTGQAERSPRIGAALDRLVALNRRDAERLAREIDRLQRAQLKADLAIGLVAVGLVGLLGLAFARTRAREREAQAERLRLAEQRNAELNAFAGQAAHDLRTPLQPVRGYADLILLAAETTPENRRRAERIKAAAEKMTRVVDEMLELARSGRPVTGEADVPAVFREVLAELAAELKGARVVERLEPCAVQLARGPLAQVLRNLLTNSLKYRAPERPLVLTLAAAGAGQMVEISVEDNGQGMDPATAERVFEPFFRAHQAAPGYGLGLSIVEAVVRGAGGHCELSSTPGAGTRVTLNLPAA